MPLNNDEYDALVTKLQDLVGQFKDPNVIAEPADPGGDPQPADRDPLPVPAVPVGPADPGGEAIIAPTNEVDPPKDEPKGK